MKNAFFAMLFACSLATLSCSKGSDPKPQKEGSKDEVKISDISLSTNTIGINQPIKYSIEKPKWIGNIVSYKWVTSNPEGKSDSKTNENNSITYFPSVAGEHKLEVYVSSLGKEAKSSTKFNVVENDFLLGRFGDNKELITLANEFAGNEEQGLTSGFFWPFSATKPNEVLEFKNQQMYETYLFSNDKLVAGNRSVFNLDYATTSNGVTRNFSIDHFYTFAVELGNKMFKADFKPSIEWKTSTSQSQKTKYENNTYGKYEGYGWALYNRDAERVFVKWSDSSKEAEAEIRSIGGGTKYYIEFTVRKK